MSDSSQRSLQASPEQLVYANLLEKGMYVGLLILFVTYLVYVLGIMKPYIPVNDIPKCWTMGVHDYLNQCNIESGWSWIHMLRYGDFINFVGIAMLAGVTVMCFLRIVPVLWKEGDRLYAFFGLLEAVILGLAASGILSGGGH
jgi:hypothetical protein